MHMIKGVGNGGKGLLKHSRNLAIIIFKSIFPKRADQNMHSTTIKNYINTRRWV